MPGGPIQISREHSRRKPAAWDLCSLPGHPCAIARGHGPPGHHTQVTVRPRSSLALPPTRGRSRHRSWACGRQAGEERQKGARAGTPGSERVEARRQARRGMHGAAKGCIRVRRERAHEQREGAWWRHLCSACRGASPGRSSTAGQCPDRPTWSVEEPRVASSRSVSIPLSKQAHCVVQEGCGRLSRARGARWECRDQSERTRRAREASGIMRWRRALARASAEGPCAARRAAHLEASRAGQ